jgi:beta-N-acetylhexosaminidase
MDLQQLKKKPFYLTDSQIEWVKKTCQGMTLEEKVGQIFCIIFKVGSDEELTENLNVMQFGGCMFRPVMDGVTAAKFINKINSKLKVPALVAANLEKGGDGLISDGTYFAPEMEVAATKNIKMAKRLADVCGREAKAIGANWAFAPIIDIDNNYRNPITNTRTFGSDPEIVREFGRAYVETIQPYGVAACIKHFPGDGMDERDQHLVTSINSTTVEEWDATYGRAYQTGIDAGAMTVMVGHIMHPAYERVLNPGVKDEDILPASLSKAMMTDLLRGKLGFNGLIVTDATTMAGYTLAMPRNKAVPTSIQNGADMFLFTRNLREDYNFMLDGVKHGYLTEERLEEAVMRVLALKVALKLDGTPVTDFDAVKAVVGCEEHRKWSLECADEAITLVKEEKGVLPLSTEKYKNILLFPIQQAPGGAGQYQVKGGIVEDVAERLKKEGFHVDIFKPSTGKEGQLPSYEETIKKYDLMLYVACMKTKSNQTVVRIEWAQPMGADCMHYYHDVPTIFVSLENPYHLQDVPRVRTYINTYSSNPQCIEMLIEKLMGRSEFKGKNPVDPFCGKWDARLS